MKNILQSLTFVLVLSNLCFSQYSPEWINRYEYLNGSWDEPYAMTADSAGNVYVTGKSYGESTGFDICTIKYNSLGNLQWTKRYTGPNLADDVPYAIAADKTGNVYVVGKSYGGSSDSDFTVIKYNSAGAQQWVDIYNGNGDSTDVAYSISVSKDGSIIYVTGKTYKFNGPYRNFDCLTIKYNSSGSRLWTRTFEYVPTNGYNEYGKFSEIDNSGNTYVAAQLETSEVFLLKYNSSGTLLWSKSYGATPSYYRVDDLTIDRNGNTYMNINSDTLGYDYRIIVKHNSSGTRLYRTTPLVTNCYCWNDVDQRTSTIAVDSLLRTFLFFSNDGFNTIMFDENGAIVWNSNYQFPFSQGIYSPYSMAIDNSGNAYVCGYANFVSTGRDFLTIKYNSSGIRQWVQRYYNLPGINDEASQVATDFSGNAFVTGYSIGLGTEYDYLTIKYPSSLQLNAKIILEGYYDTINNSLRKRDTVKAFLRNSTSPYQIVDSAKALIDPVNFTAGFCFNNADSGSYYIMLRHRNSIETWSKAGGEVLSRTSPLYYDFTASASQVFGSNLKHKGNKYCIISGDIVQDGFIDGSDLLIIDNDAYLFASGDYLRSDLSGDGYTDGIDMQIADNNRSREIIRP
jgi:hypothetical protein